MKQHSLMQVTNYCKRLSLLQKVAVNCFFFRSSAYIHDVTALLLLAHCCIRCTQFTLWHICVACHCCLNTYLLLLFVKLMYILCACAMCILRLYVFVYILTVFIPFFCVTVYVCATIAKFSVYSLKTYLNDTNHYIYRDIWKWQNCLSIFHFMEKFLNFRFLCALYPCSVWNCSSSHHHIISICDAAVKNGATNDDLSFI